MYCNQERYLNELQETCTAIEKEVGEKLFLAAASGVDHKMPDLNNFVDEYWRLAFTSYDSDLENG